MQTLKSFKIGFIGSGHMAQALIEACLNHAEVPADKLFVTSRSSQKLEKICQKFQVHKILDKEELLEQAQLVFLCVKPQDIEQVLPGLSPCFERHHTLISVVAGCSFEKIKNYLPNQERVVRLMPSLSVRVGRGLLPFVVQNNREPLQAFTKEILKPIGLPLLLDKEEDLRTFTVSSSSGLAFIFEIMEYWKEWLAGQGFSQQNSEDLTKEIFLGACMLASKNSHSLELFQKMISSKGGVTHSGLKAMRELELERILRLSFEQASLREKQLDFLD